MKKRLVALLVLVSILWSCGSIDQAWLEGVQAGVDVITVEYLEYVDLNANLKTSEKENRHATVELLQKSLATAKEE